MYTENKMNCARDPTREPPDVEAAILALIWRNLSKLLLEIRSAIEFKRCYGNLQRFFLEKIISVISINLFWLFVSYYLNSEFR